MSARWILLSLAGASVADAGPRWVVTIQPAAAIVREVAGADAEVTTLVPPGASPHTYEPRPSDVAKAERATALLAVSPLVDGWAARLPAAARIDLLALVPAAERRPFDPDQGAGTDPHFWTDPATVAAMLPALADGLCRADAAGCDGYRARARTFGEELATLERETAITLAPVRGRGLVLLHPSMRYLLARHGIRVVGVIEPSPGKEPTPRYLRDLVATIEATGARAVFTEPQLPARPAEVVAEAAHVKLGLLDPNGGVAGRTRYADLIRYNARALRETLE